MFNILIRIIDMKKRIFTSIILAIGLASMAYAQTVEENELAVVYYMPLTQLAVTIEYDEIAVKPGPFYLYAERYLGVENVTTDAQVRYEITDLQLAPNVVPDYTRPYKVVANGNETMQWLSLTPEGLLYGYNVPPYEAKQTNQPIHQQHPETLPNLMPLMEEQMVASSIAKMAEGAAKQIYHIREMRMNLLSGDIEHTPADGQAMLLVLDELNKREQMLAELFIGTRVVKHHSYTIHYVPSKDVQERIIARFSQFSGVVPANDLSGEPILLTLVGKRQAYAPTFDKDTKQNKANIPSQLYYNLPGSANIVVVYGDKIKESATLPIAQFGIALPLAKSLLNYKETPQIYFNTQTGNILSIQQ